MGLMGFIFYDLVIVYMILEKFINNVYCICILFYYLKKNLLE